MFVWYLYPGMLKALCGSHSFLGVFLEKFAYKVLCKLRDNRRFWPLVHTVDDLPVQNLNVLTPKREASS